MLLEILVATITALANLIIGLFVYYKNPKSATHRLLTFLTLQIAIWSIANYFSLHAESEANTLLWIRMVMVITSFWGPTLFLLAHTFPKTNLPLKNWAKIFVVAFNGLTALLAASPLIFSSVTITNGNITPTPGPGMVIFMINFYGFMAAALWILFKKFKAARDKERAQVRYFLLGIILNFVLSNITNFIFVLVLKLSSFVILGPSFSLILVGFLTYSIVKHRFLDIRFVVARTVSYTLLTIFLGFIYALALFVIASQLNQIHTNPTTLIASTFLSLVMALTFQPLRQFVQKITDRVFFKDNYDTSALLYELALIMASALELEDLAKKVLKHLASEMKIDSGAALMFNHGKKPHISHYHLKEIAAITHADLKLLKNRQSLTFFDELDENQTKQMLRRFNLAVVVKLEVAQELIGYLLLGPKRSGDAFSSDDERVLKILAPQAALSLQNAQRFTRIESFNDTLRNEIKKATAKLREANTQLKELDKLKDEFISVASHELRTPLTALRGYLWMVVEASHDFPAKTKAHLQRAFSSTEQVIELTNDILDVSKIEGNKFELQPSRFDLSKLVSDTKEEMASKAKEKHLYLEYTQDKPYLINADESKIRRVLVNLVGNAIKFTPSQGRISISISEVEPMVTVSIADTGMGISQSDLDHLFTKFGQFNRSLSSANQEPGTGLGLYICRNIIEMSGGKIWVTSELNQGSTFSFSLPKAK